MGWKLMNEMTFLCGISKAGVLRVVDTAAFCVENSEF
jgi:hypothetical protein